MPSAVRFITYAAQTLETRTGYYYLKAQGKLDIYKDYISGKITRDEFLQHIPEEQLQSVFCETMSNETLPRLFENIDRILTQRGIKQVDVIIGGPPCQAYSLVGRAQSKHMETPMSADPRNDLYKLYARFLQKYHPKMFVFENVMGIKSANSGATWLKVQEALRSVGYEIECHEQNSKNFGVLQNRRRMIIVGWLKNTGLSYPQFEQTIADATVNDILSDLPALQPGGKSGEYRSDDFSDYLRSTGIRKDSDILTHHCARPNKDRDIEIYRRTIELWNDGHKRLKAPFECLLNADIEPNPHQVNAFCAAIQALKTGGIILADEVGLGKTIEAGLVLNYVLDNGAKKVLISLPATLRKQWEVELLEKFGRQAVILDRYTVEHDLANVQTHLGNADEVSIVIASYDYSSKLIKRFPHVKWDFLIIDEAHNLRNVFHGTKRAKNLYDLTHGIPKILLTATPLQNSLTDLHGLVSFIDPRIFGSEKVFNRRFVDGCDYEELKQELLPVLYRTLRRDVGKYMAFSKRTCITVDFHLSAEEKELYDVTNDFLRRDPLYSIPNANRGLIILVIRKLLASSSFALIETFEVLEKRLEKLYEGTKSAYAQEGFDLFWGFVEDEIDEDGFNEYDDEETAEKKQASLIENYRPFTFLDDAEKRTEYYSESDRNKLSGFLFRINLNDKYFWVYQHIYSVSRIDRSKNVIALFVGDTYDEIDSDIVQIDSRADVIIFSSSVVTAKMDLMQRFFGFEQYIRAGAQKTIEIIRDLDIVDSLEKFVAFENKSKLTNAKKLLKAKNSPVLQMKKNDLLENLKKHSRYKTMFKFEEDHIVISSQKEAAAFIKMLNDDIVRSELTGKEYDSSSKMLLGPVGASH